MKFGRLEYRILGYSYIRLEGKQLGRFLNICLFRGIELKNLNIDVQTAACTVREEHLNLIKELGNKYNIKVNVLKKCGLPFGMKYFGKRVGFILGAVSCYLFLIYMSNCVWEMEFCGNSYHTDSSLQQYLRNNHIVFGCKMADIDAEELELRIRNDFPDVAWCSVQKEGSKLIVTITESNLEAMENSENLQPGQGISIVAEYDALITGIVTQSGEAAIVKGSTVKAGDVLVNGYITYMDDYDNIIGYKGVHAQADIRAIREIPYEISVSFGKTDKSRTLTTYSEIEPINKIFPYLYYKRTTTFPVSEENELSYEQAILRLENKLFEQIKKWKENGYEVIEKNLKIEDNNREVFYVGTILIEGPFGIETSCIIPTISEGINESDGN